MNWKNLKLGKKFFISFGSVIALLVMVAFLAINGINYLIGNTDNIVERNGVQSDLEHKYVQHLQWAQEVNKLLTDNDVTELSVETDHTKCAFGKWYYGEERKHVEELIPELKPYLESIEEPHIHLHKSAIKINDVFYQADVFSSSKFGKIKSAHLLWTHAIKDALLQKKSTLNIQTDHYKCILGTWLNSDEIKQKRINNPEFDTLIKKIEEPHEYLHTSAIQIENYLKQGNFNAAYRYYNNNTNKYALQTLDLIDDIITWNNDRLKGMEVANEIYNNETIKHLSDVGGLFESIISTSKSTISIINKSMIQKAFSTRLRVILFSLLAIIIAIVLSIIITKGIVSPIKKSVLFAQKVASGDLTSVIDIDQNDEIGNLAIVLQQMIGKLKEIVATVKEGADNIATASQGMSSTSQQISQGANLQASSAEEVSSSMEEMSSNIQQNTDNAQQTEKIAVKSADGIKASNESTEISVKAMKEIADKITIINDIAFQTNILALNAAIEAARAGEQGKGFAVVAAEVRKLAERSKVAADEIVELSQNGVVISEKAGDQLLEIMPEIEKTAQLVQEIAAASLEQNTGSDQVNSAIQQLNQVTQQNAAASEEMATGAEELASQAEQLIETISYFKTDNENIKKSHNQISRKNVANSRKQNNIGINRDSLDTKGYNLKIHEQNVSDNYFENY